MEYLVWGQLSCKLVMVIFHMLEIFFYEMVGGN